eukprot:354169-Chlamydomonas_euryale.AAC.5
MDWPPSACSWGCLPRPLGGPTATLEEASGWHRLKNMRGFFLGHGLRPWRTTSFAPTACSLLVLSDASIPRDGVAAIPGAAQHWGSGESNSALHTCQQQNAIDI